MSNNDSVDVFLDKAAKIPLLTPEEETINGRFVQSMMQLLAKKPSGPYTKAEKVVLVKGKRAKDRFINANLRLVASLARKYERSIHGRLNMTPEDMLQEGMLGLIRAVEKFDPQRGYRFSTYAYWWIRQAISRALHLYGRTIRLPINIAEKITGRGKLIQQLRDELGREPLTKEVAEKLGMDVHDYEWALRMGSRCSSLDQPATGRDDGSCIGELIASESSADEQLEELSNRLDRRRLRHALADLAPVQRKVLELRFGFNGEPPMAWRCVGQRLGISGEAARMAAIRGEHELKRRLTFTSQIQEVRRNVVAA